MGGFSPGYLPSSSFSNNYASSSVENKEESSLGTYNHINMQPYERHANDDFTVSLGKYVERHGVLKEAGSNGVSFGVEYAAFKKFINDSNAGSKNSHGFFLNWGMDHFSQETGVLFRPEYRGEDFTNYLLGGGYAYRRLLSDYVQLHYRAGLALNFIEVDTFKSNGDEDDAKYTDTTISLTQKIGIDFLIQKVKPEDTKRKAQIRVGPSLFYYFAPDPIGKFRLTDNGDDLHPGGSLAIQLEFKFEIY